MGSANRKFKFGELFAASFITVLATGFFVAVASKFIGTQRDRELEANEAVVEKRPAEVIGGAITAVDRPAAAALWKEIYFKTFEKTGLVNTSRDAADDAVRNTYGK